jgi:Na+/phosphate symporter
MFHSIFKIYILFVISTFVNLFFYILIILTPKSREDEMESKYPY